MKIGAIVICRYNSSRLPGKILKEINGKPLISYILERLSKVENLDDFVIATSSEETDQPIIDYCEENNIKYFRGSLTDVASRFLNCAEHFGFDYAIRVNGDNLFLDSRIMSEMVKITKENNYDLVTNVKDRTFPKGVSVEILKTIFYKKKYSSFDNNYFKEHVTIYFYENEGAGNYYYYKNETCKDAAGVQLAIDTLEDFRIAENILMNMSGKHTEYGFEDVYQRYLEVK